MKKKQKTLIILLISLVLLSGVSIFGWNTLKTEAEFNIGESAAISENLSTVQGNSLLAISDPAGPEWKVIKKLLMIATGYSSTEDQTDSNPFITAAGTWVKDGVIANNYLPFGTKVRLPELYGDKIFVIEDRMSWKKGNYHIDIWFPNREEALKFGARLVDVLVLSN